MPNLLKNRYSIIFFIVLSFCARSVSLAQNWQTVGGGLSYYAHDLNVDTANSCILIAGEFNYADTLNCAGLVKWDEINFSTYSHPISSCSDFYCGPAYKLINYHNRLFMTGRYGPYDGKVEELFEHVNSNWVVSCKIDGAMEGLFVLNDKLFALGIFDSLCSNNIKSLAVFNGLNWESFNPPSPINSSYRFMSAEYYKGEYYFAGNFHDGNYKNIIRWTGTQWDHCGNGIPGGFVFIRCMKAYKGILYVGGYFYEPAGNPADFLMAWNGNNWFDPFPQVQYLDLVTDMEVINDQLYLSGGYTFPYENDSTMYVMARFDGCNFNAFGGSVKYPEFAVSPNYIAGLNGQIYAAVADSFLHQEAKYLVSIPESVPNIKSVRVSSCSDVITTEFNLYPNPYSDNITIQLSSDYYLTETKFTITNSLGQNLFTVYPESYKELLDLSALSSGMYFITVQDNSNKKTVKVIKQ